MPSSLRHGPRPAAPRRAGAVLAAGLLATGLAALVGAAPAGPAGAARTPSARPAAAAARARAPRTTEQACLAGNQGIAWSGLISGGGRVGATVTISASLHCGGSAGAPPVVGVPMSAAVAPAGLATVSGPATVPTGANGTAVFHLVGRRPGTGTVVVAVADGGACGAAYGPSYCHLTFHLRLQPAAGLPPAHPGPVYGIVPPRDPALNSPQAPYAAPACQPAGRLPASGYSPSVACADAYVRLIDAALAKEHAHPVHLPTNWARLTPAEQLFVTADLERVARGLPPYVGLSAPLDALAQAGAVANRDPSPPASGVLGAGSNWAGGEVSAAAADYAWMYLDGWGGAGRTGNLDCNSPHASGCWGHRDNILGRYTGLECTDCVMGAGAVLGARGGQGPSLTELFVEPARAGQFPVFFTWAKNVLPYLKG